MEVRSAGNTLINRAAAAIDNSGSGAGGRQQSGRSNAVIADQKPEYDDQSVLISISAAGLKKSRSDKRETEDEDKEKVFVGGAELEEMTKKMEGLSSQVINGNFPIADRLRFHAEISKLTAELERLGGGSAPVTMDHCAQLSHKITDLTRAVSEAAVYRNSARTVFMVNSRQPAAAAHTRLDIAL